jgi:hypothetical protein
LIALWRQRGYRGQIYRCHWCGGWHVGSSRHPP